MVHQDLINLYVCIFLLSVFVYKTWVNAGDTDRVTDVTEVYSKFKFIILIIRLLHIL